MMTEGENRDTGIFDRIRRLLNDRLTAYTHSTVNVPFPRIVTSLKNGEDWCFVGGVKTPEREGFAVFSRPVAMFYPLRIVVRAANRARFEALGPLSLRDLLSEHRELRTQHAAQPRHRPGGGCAVPEYPPGQTHSEFGEASACMLNDRLDYLVVEFSSIAAYNARQIGEPGAFVGLPFAEENRQPVFARVMCAARPGDARWWHTSTRCWRPSGRAGLSRHRRGLDGAGGSAAYPRRLRQLPGERLSRERLNETFQAASAASSASRSCPHERLDPDPLSGQVVHAHPATRPSRRRRGSASPPRRPHGRGGRGLPRPRTRLPSASRMHSDPLVQWKR